MEDVEVRNSDEGAPSDREGRRGEERERKREQERTRKGDGWGGKVSDDEEISMT